MEKRNNNGKTIQHQRSSKRQGKPGSQHPCPSGRATTPGKLNDPVGWCPHAQRVYDTLYEIIVRHCSELPSCAPGAIHRVSTDAQPEPGTAAHPEPGAGQKPGPDLLGLEQELSAGAATGSLGLRLVSDEPGGQQPSGEVQGAASESTTKASAGGNPGGRTGGSLGDDGNRPQQGPSEDRHAPVRTDGDRCGHPTPSRLERADAGSPAAEEGLEGALRGRAPDGGDGRVHGHHRGENESSPPTNPWRYGAPPVPERLLARPTERVDGGDESELRGEADQRGHLQGYYLSQRSDRDGPPGEFIPQDGIRIVLQRREGQALTPYERKVGRVTIFRSSQHASALMEIPLDHLSLVSKMLLAAQTGQRTVLLIEVPQDSLNLVSQVISLEHEMKPHQLQLEDRTTSSEERLGRGTLTDALEEIANHPGRPSDVQSDPCLSCLNRKKKRQAEWKQRKERKLEREKEAAAETEGVEEEALPPRREIKNEDPSLQEKQSRNYYPRDIGKEDE